MSVARNLITIFYLPLVLIAFLLVFAVGASFVGNNFSSQNKLNLTDGSFDYKENKAYFNGRAVAAPSQPQIAYNSGTSKVLSASSGEKRVDVNLSTQTLTAFEPDGSVFMQVPVSTGLWAPTPAGTYRIWTKLRYTKMSGGSQANGTYYYLPNVPCTQYFYKGYGLHGTYWHNNFGHPMSHGCVNMYTPDACKLFEWTSPPIAQGQNQANPTAENPGTLVVTHY